jgi:hypothetical protein
MKLSSLSRSNKTSTLKDTLELILYQLLGLKGFVQEADTTLAALESMAIIAQKEPQLIAQPLAIAVFYSKSYWSNEAFIPSLAKILLALDNPSLELMIPLAPLDWLENLKRILLDSARNLLEDQEQCHSSHLDVLLESVALVVRYHTPNFFFAQGFSQRDSCELLLSIMGQSSDSKAACNACLILDAALEDQVVYVSC